MSDVQYRAVPAAVADGSIVLPLATSKGETVVTVALPTGGALTYTDKSIASMSGASEALMAANTSRRAMIVQNTGTSDVGLRWVTAGTAAIGGAGTMTLKPAQAFIVTGSDATTVAVTVIGTAGQPVYAAEGV